MLPNLLAAGHMYEVEGLKAACEARLAAKATVSNALELLELAQECHAQVGGWEEGTLGEHGGVKRDVVVPISASKLMSASFRRAPVAVGV
jgi:hypothetical protein